MDVTLTDCPVCQVETVHDVHKERGRELTVECRDCGRTHQVVASKRIDVPVQLSMGDETTSTSIDVAEDDVIQVGDRMFLEDGLAEVTAVEDEDARRPDELVAQDIETIWAKDIREVALKFTVNHGRTSTSLETTVGPDAEVVVGDLWTVERKTIRIDRIKSEAGMLRRDGDSVEALDVVRVYGDRVED